MNAKEAVKILLVDDQPAKLLTYRTILKDLGEELIAVGSGKEALQYLLRNEVAVLLIDVVMPDLDGFELATMIRDHPRFERTAIIFVSAIALTDLDRLKGYERGAVDYVPVPVVPELLRAKVRVFAELYRKTRQLEMLNAELEHRVEERTVQLAEANAELERRVEQRTRERESALAQVHEMQKLESLGQLTGGVAHDFNNVLMAILGNLEVVSRGSPDAVTTPRLVADAIRAAQRGAGLVQHMLAFARRQELRPEAVDVSRLIANSVDMLRRSVGPAIEIGVEFADDIGLVLVDPNQLELAVVNLTVNARDAMPLGGRIIIAGHREKIGAGSALKLNPGEYVRLMVTDTGVGMDDDTLKRASEPFFTTKGPGKGTGLGLSMVFGLAAQSGGAAHIHSRLGVGTTVELWLPLAERPDRPALSKTIAPELKPSRPRRILVVDDDRDVLAATVSMLELLGHDVLVSSSGPSALDIVRSDPKLDLVVTDHAMPGMTGIELAERIRRDRPEIALILATGYADLDIPEASGVRRIRKPYRLDALAAMIVQIEEPEGGCGDSQPDGRGDEYPGARRPDEP